MTTAKTQYLGLNWRDKKKRELDRGGLTLACKNRTVLEKYRYAHTTSSRHSNNSQEAGKTTNREQLKGTQSRRKYNTWLDVLQSGFHPRIQLGPFSRAEHPPVENMNIKSECN